jgi:segregation and condensation protein B
MDELETQAQGTPEGAAPQEDVPAEQAVTDAATHQEAAPQEEAAQPESAPEEVKPEAAASEEAPQETVPTQQAVTEAPAYEEDATPQQTETEDAAKPETATDAAAHRDDTPAEATPQEPATDDTAAGEAEEEGAEQSEQDAPQTISIEEWMASSQQTTVVETPTTAEIEDVQLLAVLEACVYVAEEPLMPAQIAAALNQGPERIRALMQQLIAEFDKPEHGVCIKEVAGGYKMATKAEHHEAVRAFVKSLKAPLKLSLPALETLAVVAYKQPVTGPEIMDIRGVQGGGVLKTLLDRKLITEAGRKNVIGKPILYKTTKEFLITFGLKDLAELPTLKEFEEIRRMAMSEPETAAEAPPAEAATPLTPAEAEAPAQEAEAEPPAPEASGAIETPAEAAPVEAPAQEAEAEPPAPEASGAIETPAEAAPVEAPAQEAEAEPPAPEAPSAAPEPEKPATTESQEH